MDNIIILFNRLDISNNKILNKNALIIQKNYNGFLTRKQLSDLNDNFTFELLKKLYNKYIDGLLFTININNQLLKKKIRNENFPSHISENIVKFAIYKKYNIMPCWDTNVGDLIINKNNILKKIEVKGFMSTGPTSFGPTENWDWIYFVDAINILTKKIIIYEIKLSNKNIIWQNIKINKNQTYYDQCVQKRRPRLSFQQIKNQLIEYCTIIFTGNIDDLQ